MVPPPAEEREIANAGYLVSDTNAERSLGAEPRVEVISPELVLVDPELAARARALLPWPEPTFRATVPRERPAAERPVVVDSSTLEAPPIEILPPLERESSFRFARRLAAIAAVLPALVTLAFIGEFVGRSGNPYGATTPKQDRGPAARAVGSRSQPRAKHQSDGGNPAPAKQRAARLGRAPHFRGDRVDGIVAMIGESPEAVTRAFGAPTSWDRNGQYCGATWNGEGLTLMFVARRHRNPCTRGRVTGGFTTGRRWPTAAGLSVGSSVRELRRRYPHAEPVGSGWWMLATISRGAPRHGIPLHAHVRSGRVDKILVN